MWGHRPTTTPTDRPSARPAPRARRRRHDDDDAIRGFLQQRERRPLCARLSLWCAAAPAPVDTGAGPVETPALSHRPAAAQTFISRAVSILCAAIYIAGQLVIVATYDWRRGDHDDGQASDGWDGWPDVLLCTVENSEFQCPVQPPCATSYYSPAPALARFRPRPLSGLFALAAPRHPSGCSGQQRPRAGCALHRAALHRPAGHKQLYIGLVLWPAAVYFGGSICVCRASSAVHLNSLGPGGPISAARPIRVAPRGPGLAARPNNVRPGPAFPQIGPTSRGNIGQWGGAPMRPRIHMPSFVCKNIRAAAGLQLEFEIWIWKQVFRFFLVGVF